MTVRIGPFIEAVTLPRNASPRDPLGRKPGEVLDPKKFTVEAAEARKRNTPKRTWFAMWQQTPIVEGGNLLSRDDFLKRNPKRVLKIDEFDRMTDGLLWCRFWDLAYTAKAYDKPNPDYTVGTLMAFKFDEHMTRFDIFVRHQYRDRGNWSDVKKWIRQYAVEDGKSCYIGGEANGPQKAAVEDLRTDPALMEYIVWGIPSGMSKKDRAELWMDRAREGQMWLCEGKWNNTFFDEAEGFPNAPHDDAIDSMSGAYAMCAQRSSEYQPGVVVGAVDFNSRW